MVYYEADIVVMKLGVGLGVEIREKAGSRYLPPKASGQTTLHTNSPRGKPPYCILTLEDCIIEAQAAGSNHLPKRAQTPSIPKKPKLKI